MPKRYTMCAAKGCTKGAAPSGFTRFCSGHAERRRRNGHELQRPISKPTVEGLRKLVRRLRDAAGGVAAEGVLGAPTGLWPDLEWRWRSVLAHARLIQTASSRDLRWSVTEQKAAAIMLQLEKVEYRRIEDTVLGMYVAQECEAHWFKSDDGWRFQLVRALKLGNAIRIGGSTYIHALGKSVYRYKPPNRATMLVLAGWLEQAFGAAGHKLARVEFQGRVEEQRVGNARFEALKEFSTVAGG
jgi:hypothetical protein